MADEPQITLEYAAGCPDCAQRVAVLPPALPPVGDDFDWAVRDYDGFRIFMLQELMAAFPERPRWTPADLEVVIVEALAAVLDQLSDMLDRITAEAYLETARRPESVRRLLEFIGYHAELETGVTPAPSVAELESHWARHPEQMEAARRAGPRAVQQQRRMVTAADYATLMQAHPLVSRATAWVRWTGSWSTVTVAVIAWDDHTPLDGAGIDWTGLETPLHRFADEHGLTLPPLTPQTSLRTLLQQYLDHARMAGQEAVLEDAGVVGISMSISVQVADDYFQSEIRDQIRTSIAAFFAPGQRSFGESLYESDIIKLLTGIEGVLDACLNRFKRVGRASPDDTASGVVAATSTQLIVCDNDPTDPDRGYYRLILHGGRRG